LWEEELVHVTVNLQQALNVEAQEVIIFCQVSRAPDVIECSWELLPEVYAELITEIVEVKPSEFELQYCFAYQFFLG
jgi:hypothetical protein